MFSRRNIRHISFARSRPSALAKARTRSLKFRTTLNNSSYAMPVGRPGTEEIKCLDTVLGTDNTTLAVISAPPTPNEPGAWAAGSGITYLNQIQIGSNFFNRVGSKVSVKSVELKFNLQENTIGGIDNSFARWMLIYDRQPNGALPAITDILGVNGGAPTFGAGIFMPNRSRFTVIRDQVVTLDSGSGLIKQVKAFCKGRWDTEFGSTNGNITDIKSGAILFVCFMDTVSAGAPTIGQFESRIRYWD